jgi:hypothetical protein
MKYLTYGTLAVIAMLAIALSGAASASAAGSYCSTKTSPCTGIEYGVGIGNDLEGALKKGTEASFGWVGVAPKCSESTLDYNLEDKNLMTGDPTGELTLSFGNCSCPVTTIKNGSIETKTEIAGKPNGNATLVDKGTQITFNCGGNKCVWGWATAGGTFGQFVGGAPAVINVKATLSFFETDESEFECTGLKNGTATATFTATYEVTEPNPAFFG